MVDRIIALIAISGIISLMSTIHSHAYANLIMGKNEINSNQIHHFYRIATLITNQTSDKEFMSEVKSQIEHTDPFKVKGSDNQRNIANQSSTEGTHPNDVNSNNLKHTNGNDCKSNCPEKSKPTKYDIPFELPSIPFP